MKKRRLKKGVKISLLVVALGLAITSYAVYSKNKDVKPVASYKDFTYVNDYIFDNYYPVINNEDKIVKPYTVQNVSIYKNFYDKDAADDVQQKSIVYYDNVYMQNSGIDYSSDAEFDVVASLGGTVTNVNDDSLLGKTIEVKSTNDIVTTYQSLSSVTVKKGDVITTGQLIAKSGTCTLNSDVKNGLHFEMYKSGTIVNPEKYYGKAVKDLTQN